jgi:hypothetical protein
MLSIGSKALSWFVGPGDGARLASWGSGEKEKLGEKGILRVVVEFEGPLREEVVLGGEKGRIAADDGLVSSGLGSRDAERAPPDAPSGGRWVADVGVGRVALWIRGFGALEAVDLRFFAGWPLVYEDDATACCV